MVCKNIVVPHTFGLFVNLGTAYREVGLDWVAPEEKIKEGLK